MKVRRGWFMDLWRCQASLHMCTAAPQQFNLAEGVSLGIVSSICTCLQQPPCAGFSRFLASMVEPGRWRSLTEWFILLGGFQSFQNEGWDMDSVPQGIREMGWGGEAARMWDLNPTVVIQPMLEVPLCTTGSPSFWGVTGKQLSKEVVSAEAQPHPYSRESSRASHHFCF